MCCTAPPSHAPQGGWPFLFWTLLDTPIPLEYPRPPAGPLVVRKNVCCAVCPFVVQFTDLDSPARGPAGMMYLILPNVNHYTLAHIGEEEVK